jgi:phage-related holin
MTNERIMTGGLAGGLALLAPIRGLILCAVIFVAIDFATGVAASRCRARREGRQWSFSSRRAWDTALKSVMVMAGIVLAWLLDSVVAPIATIHLARMFTGFVCGVEFWSYLENAADITGGPLFPTLRRVLKRRFDGAMKKTSHPQ